MEQPQPARHAARARKARVLRLLPKSERAQWRARARYAKVGCANRRPQLTRHITVLNRRRKASRWCSALLSCTERPQPALHDARVRQARVLRLLNRESQRSGASASATLKPAAQRGGRSRHVAARPCAEGGRPLACALPFRRARSDPNQRGPARMREERACAAPPFEREREQSCACMCAYVKAGCAWQPQLACRSTALHRRREASCYCSSLS